MEGRPQGRNLSEPKKTEFMGKARLPTRAFGDARAIKHLEFLTGEFSGDHEANRHGCDSQRPEAGVDLARRQMSGELKHNSVSALPAKKPEL